MENMSLDNEFKKLTQRQKAISQIFLANLGSLIAIEPITKDDLTAVIDYVYFFVHQSDGKN